MLPQGFTANNAALAFRDDGRRLAACTELAAKLWGLPSGTELESWPLPPGLMNQIAFRSSGPLLLFRCESSDRRQLPLYDNDFRDHPRVCRIRDLLGRVPLTPLAEFPGFNRRVLSAVTVRDGRSFIVEGSHEGEDDRYSAIKALDGLTGEERWSVRTGGPDKGGWNLVLDGSREHVIVGIGEGPTQRLSLREASTGREVRSMDQWEGRSSPDGNYFLTMSAEDPGIALHGRDGRHLLNLGIDQKPVSVNARSFSPDGNTWPGARRTAA